MYYIANSCVVIEPITNIGVSFNESQIKNFIFHAFSPSIHNYNMRRKKEHQNIPSMLKCG